MEECSKNATLHDILLKWSNLLYFRDSQRNYLHLKEWGIKTLGKSSEQEYKKLTVIKVKFEKICLLKVNNRNTRTRCKIYWKLTIKTPERRQWRRSAVFIVNFEHISHLVLVFLLLILSRQDSLWNFDFR